MKYSRAIVISMAILLVSGNTVFAGTVPATTTNTATTVTTTEPTVTQTAAIPYSEALEKMLQNNIQIVTLQNQIKLQDDVIKEAEVESKRYEFEIKTKDNALSRGKIIYLNPITAKNTKSELIRNLSDKKIALKEDLVKYYIDWQTSANTLALYNEILTIQQKEYDNKNLQFKLGKVSSKEVATIKSNVTTAISNVNKTKRDMDLLVLKFNVLIDNSHKSLYKPDSSSVLNILKVNSLDFSDQQLEKIVAANTEKDSTLAKLKEDITAIKEEFRVEQLYGEAGTIQSDYDKKMSDNKDSQETKVIAVEYQVYLDYYTMRSLETDIESCDENLNLLQLQYDVTEAKFKLGMATNLELLKAKKDIQEMQDKKLVAQYELYRSYTEFTKNLEK